MRTYKIDQLRFSAIERCTCGAGLAYPPGYGEEPEARAWTCSRVLLGEVPLGADPAPSDLVRAEAAGHVVKPFPLWNVVPEGGTFAGTDTTRPLGQS